jgi:DNA-binding MarR family transcriptional regulator/GNAT superfamily N-acetyltransferase
LVASITARGTAGGARTGQAREHHTAHVPARPRPRSEHEFGGRHTRWTTGRVGPLLRTGRFDRMGPRTILDGGKYIVDFRNYMPQAKLERDSDGAGADRVAAVRAFNRFYTATIGVLQDRVLRSELSLTQVRVLYELAHHDDLTATDLRTVLRVDPGYLSRLITSLETRRMIARGRSATDGRKQRLRLTARGRRAFQSLNDRASAEVATLLDTLTLPEQMRLVGAMAAIQTLLGETRHRANNPYLLRPHRPGDMGWVVNRHGVLYANEYGWDERFEGLVARIVADFIEHFDPSREYCWIAERDGANVGSIFLVKHPDRPEVAKLRLLLVEPSARGLGIGQRLVDECTRFARRAGYKRITLWTNNVLVSARRIYEAVGYDLVHEEPHTSFGHDLVGQTWELIL